MNTFTDHLRWIFSALGGYIAILEPTLPYIFTCTMLILADCYTAWRLAQRARKQFPDRVSEDGKKFNSHHFGNVIETILKAWAAILMGFLIQHNVTTWLPVDLANIAASAICFWQIFSMVENESSCNGAKWAKIAQRFLVDKTERHFDIDLSELKTQE